MNSAHTRSPTQRLCQLAETRISNRSRSSWTSPPGLEFKSSVRLIVCIAHTPPDFRKHPIGRNETPPAAKNLKKNSNDRRSCQKSGCRSGIFFEGRLRMAKSTRSWRHKASVTRDRANNRNFVPKCQNSSGQKIGLPNPRGVQSYNHKAQRKRRIAFL